VDSGVIHSPRRSSLGERLEAIYRGLGQILAKHPVTDLALERQVFVKNVTNAAAVFCACGVVTLAAHQNGLQVAEYTPTQIKAAVTGSGNAGKRDVQDWLTRILVRQAPISPDHAADAAAAAICHIHNRDIARGLSRRIA
jgi:crossover junction endodeoxyribonuclease RuvC